MAQGPHPLATRRAALRKVAKGELRTEVCRQLGLDPKTLRKWIKEQAEGKIPGQHNRSALIPVDEAPSALAMPAGGKLDETMAVVLPVGTPQDLWKNAMAQKIAKAVQDAPIPQPSKISEWRQLVGMMNEILGVGGKGGAKAPPAGFAGNLSIRMEVVSRPPRSARPIEAEIVASEGDEDDEEID